LQVVYLETHRGHKVKFLHKVSRAALAQVTERKDRVSVEGFRVSQGWPIGNGTIPRGRLD